MKEKFSKSIAADAEAYYMSCPEAVGKHIARRLSRFNSAAELCCAVGMLTVQLAEEMSKVIAVDINEERIVAAKHNAKLYGVEEKIEFIVGDVLDIELLKKVKAEVAILDPDWSLEGEEKSLHVNTIDGTQPSMREMFRLTKEYITPNMVSRVPKHFTFKTLSDLGLCKLENIFWEGRLRFKVAYFLDDVKENKENDISFD